MQRRLGSQPASRLTRWVRFRLRHRDFVPLLRPVFWLQQFYREKQLFVKTLVTTYRTAQADEYCPSGGRGRILPERDEGFEALANVALALKSAECQHNLEPYLPLIAAHIQQAIVVPKKTRSLPSGEALHVSPACLECKLNVLPVLLLPCPVLL